MITLSQEERMKKYKTQINHIVIERQLSSIMNNTKWIELVESIKKLPFLPPYEIKCILDQEVPKLIDEDVNYLGNWDDEIIKPFYAIEWLAIRPRYLKHRGRLINDELIDEVRKKE